MEKISVQTNIRPASSDEDEQVNKAPVDEPYWQPGYMRRFPVLGFGSILLVVICSIASVAVLVISNGKSATQWTQRLAPNVVISALTSVTNLALMYAVATGAAIAWWRKAMRGATVAELHGSWGQISSMWELVKNIFRLDTMGIAALAAKLVVIDGILFQRSTTTYVGQDPMKNITMMGVASMEFPQTGYVVNEGFGAQSNCECFMIGDEYTPVVNNWETSNGFFKGYNRFFQVCDGTCFANIEAIGFEISCTKEQSHTNVAESALAAYKASGGSSNNSSAWSNLPIFNSSFSVTFANESRNYSTIDFSLLYFQSEDPYNPSSASCPGTVYTVNCALRPALVRYPVTITNYTNEHILNGVSLGVLSDLDRDPDEKINDPAAIAEYSFINRQAEGFIVGEYLYPSESQKYNATTHLGGIANALSQYLSSSAAITYTGKDTWALQQRGTLAQTMMFGPPNMGSCDCSFKHDALDTIVNNINQLTFLTATGLIDDSTFTFPKQALDSKYSSVSASVSPDLTVNSSTRVTVKGIGQNLTTNFRDLHGVQEVRDVIHYHTDYLYMGLGVGVTLLCVLLVLPVYWKYGELGRDVTLGPIEIAGAFRAPILSHATHDTTGADTSSPTNNTPSTPATPSAPAIAFSNIEELIQEVGHRKVTYGFIDVDGPSDVPEPGTTHLSPTSGTVKRRSVLAFQDSADPKVRPASGIFKAAPSSSQV